MNTEKKVMNYDYLKEKTLKALSLNISNKNISNKQKGWDIFALYFKDFIEYYTYPYFASNDYESNNIEFKQSIRLKSNLSKEEKKKLEILQSNIFKGEDYFSTIFENYILDISIYSSICFDAYEIRNKKLSLVLIRYYYTYKLFEIIFEENNFSCVFDYEKVINFKLYENLLEIYKKDKNENYLSVLWKNNPEVKKFYDDLCFYS
jgi:hypothetical protein